MFDLFSTRLLLFGKEYILNLTCKKQTNKIAFDFPRRQTKKFKMLSEEISKLNKALKHCGVLKEHLRGSLVHLQELNEKYNKIDYQEHINLLEQTRRNIMSNYSPCTKAIKSGKTRASVLSLSSPVLQKSSITKRISLSSPSTEYQSTPSKQSVRSSLLQPVTKTPTNSKRDRFAHETAMPIKRTHIKRSAYELRQNNNTVMVRTLKIHRNIETILTHLSVLQRRHHKHYVTMLEQSLYQDCNNSFDSPGKLGHFHCFNTSGNINDCHNTSMNGGNGLRNSSKREANDSMCYRTPVNRKRSSEIHFTPMANYRKTLNLSLGILRT